MPDESFGVKVPHERMIDRYERAFGSLLNRILQSPGYFSCEIFEYLPQYRC